jgi:calcineurin-like phosphoesterase family protein
MARWFTADLHLSHQNIIRFCDRPFTTDAYVAGVLTHVGDTHHMNEGIVTAINSTVTEDDELWILGDVALGNVDSSLPIIRRLRAGRIVLVAGNHDRCHPSNGPKHERWIDRYATSIGIDTLILTETTLTLPGGTSVLVNHFPYPSNRPGGARPGRGTDGTPVADRFADWRPADTGGWLLCGHAHDAFRQQGRQINVGLDAWAGHPVQDITVEALIHAGPADLPALRWQNRSGPPPAEENPDA